MDIGSIKDLAKPLPFSSDGQPSLRIVGRTADPASFALSADEEQAEDSTAPTSREEVKAAIGNIQDFVQSIRRNLNFSLDENSGRVVVKVTDSVSGEVIRQIPSEEALKLAENLSEVRSLLFSTQV